MARLILASASPRRAALLRQLGLEPLVQPAHVDEGAVTGTPTEQVRSLARRKAEALVGSTWAGWILGADTLGVLDDAVIGKPRDRADAVQILGRLSGGQHQVLTGVACVRVEEGEPVAREDLVAATTVHFGALSPATIEAYVATGEADGKAGAYAIQGRAAAFVSRIDGAWSTVVGLPLHETVRLLSRLDFPLPAHLVVE